MNLIKLKKEKKKLENELEEIKEEKSSLENKVDELNERIDDLENEFGFRDELEDLQRKMKI